MCEKDARHCQLNLNYNCWQLFASLGEPGRCQGNQLQPQTVCNILMKFEECADDVHNLHRINKPSCPCCRSRPQCVDASIQLMIPPSCAVTFLWLKNRSSMPCGPFFLAMLLWHSLDSPAPELLSGTNGSWAMSRSRPRSTGAATSVVRQAFLGTRSRSRMPHPWDGQGHAGPLWRSHQPRRKCRFREQPQARPC